LKLIERALITVEGLGRGADEAIDDRQFLACVRL
jgi:hypothetical protein